MSDQSEAGKGDRNRSNTPAYREGYDQIDWSRKGPSEVDAPAEDMPSPYSLEMYFHFLRYLHGQLRLMLRHIPFDDDGDIAPCEMEAVNYDLLVLATNVEDELRRIHRVVSFIQ